MIPADQPALLTSNKSYRYGDGLFETIKVIRGRILLQALHLERLFSSMALLELRLPPLVTATVLKDMILELCQKNNCMESARVRLSVYNGNGGLFEENHHAGYCIECWPLDQINNRLNENGLVTGIFPEGRKSCDRFSGLKSASYQLYALAARYARKQQLNDCFVVNTRENIADSAIANLFLVKEGTLITPPLSEGGVDGVMRRYLLQQLPAAGITVLEKPVSPGELQEADEVFLTNAIKGIRWVRQHGNTVFTCAKTVEIYDRFVKTLFD